MSQNSEEALRKSLDSIDSFRRRIFWSGWIVVAATFAAFYWLSHVLTTSNNPKQLLNAAVMALAALIMWCTYSVILIIIRMTKRILRAIEIAARASTDRLRAG